MKISVLFDLAYHVAFVPGHRPVVAYRHTEYGPGLPWPNRYDSSPLASRSIERIVRVGQGRYKRGSASLGHRGSDRLESDFCSGDSASRSAASQRYPSRGTSFTTIHPGVRGPG